MWRMRWRFIQCIDCMFYFYDVCHNIIWCETVCRLYVFIFLTCFMTLYGVLTVWFISVTCVQTACMMTFSVLRSAKRAPAIVRPLNNSSDVIFYCSVGERSRALALLNAALVCILYVFIFVTCVMTLSSMLTVCVTLWRLWWRCRVSSLVVGVLRGQQLHGVRRAAGRSPAQLLQGLRHSHRPRPLMDAALQGLSQNSKPYPST